MSIRVYYSCMNESIKRESGLLQEPDFQEFIEFRGVAAEDFGLLEALLDFPKNIFNEFHNFFNLSRERSVTALAAQIESADDPNRRRFLELLLSFTQKYNWQTSYNLIRVFERRA